MKRAAVLLLAAALFVSPLAAKKPNPLVRAWNEKIQAAVGLLRRGEMEPARAITDQVLREMREEVFPGEGSAKAFAMTLMLHAIAEAGLGQTSASAWHWQIAQQLDPALESWNLSEFGAVAAELDRHRLAQDPPPAAPDGARFAAEGITKPERLSAGAPPMPSKSSIERFRDDLAVLNVYISESGEPSHPRFEKLPLDLSFALATSEWLREARFRPATKAGEPIAVLFAVSYGFRVVQGR